MNGKNAVFALAAMPPGQRKRKVAEILCSPSTRNVFRVEEEEQGSDIKFSFRRTKTQGADFAMTSYDRIWRRALALLQTPSLVEWGLLMVRPRKLEFAGFWLVGEDAHPARPFGGAAGRFFALLRMARRGMGDDLRLAARDCFSLRPLLLLWSDCHTMRIAVKTAFSALPRIAGWRGGIP